MTNQETQINPDIQLVLESLSGRARPTEQVSESKDEGRRGKPVARRKNDPDYNGGL